MPPATKNRLRKNSKKKSSYASNKIEGNPLTEKQANEAIDSDPHKHFLNMSRKSAILSGLKSSGREVEKERTLFKRDDS